MISGTLNPALIRWGGLIAIALAELTWLAIRVEGPSTGYLSYFKGLPSIFVISLAVVTVPAWARFRGNLLELPIFQHNSHSPWRMLLSHWGSFASFFWRSFICRFSLKDQIGKETFIPLPFA